MTTRRRFLQQSALLIGTQRRRSARACTPRRPRRRQGLAHGRRERATGARLHAFGAQQAIWEDYTPDVQAALGRIARAIAAFQPVTVYCRPEERRLAEHHCGAARVRFEEAPLDDIWIRDIGPVFLADGQGSGRRGLQLQRLGRQAAHGADSRLAKTMRRPGHRPPAQRPGRRGRRHRDRRLGTAIDREQLAQRQPQSALDQGRDRAGAGARSGVPQDHLAAGIKGRDITDATSTSMPALPAPAWSSPTWTWIRIPTTTNDAHLDILMRSTDADGKPLDIHLPPPQNPSCATTRFRRRLHQLLRHQRRSHRARVRRRQGRRPCARTAGTAVSGAQGGAAEHRRHRVGRRRIHCVTNQMPAA